MDFKILRYYKIVHYTLYIYKHILGVKSGILLIGFSIKAITILCTTFLRSKNEMMLFLYKYIRHKNRVYKAQP